MALGLLIRALGGREIRLLFLEKNLELSFSPFFLPAAVSSCEGGDWVPQEPRGGGQSSAQQAGMMQGIHRGRDKVVPAPAYSESICPPRLVCRARQSTRGCLGTWESPVAAGGVRVGSLEVLG